MSWNRLAASRRDVLDLRFGQRLVTEVGAQKPGRVQIDFPAQDLRELAFHLKKRQSRHMMGVELNQNVYIAVRMEVVP